MKKIVVSILAISYVFVIMGCIGGADPGTKKALEELAKKVDTNTTALSQKGNNTGVSAKLDSLAMIIEDLSKDVEDLAKDVEQLKKKSGIKIYVKDRTRRRDYYRHPTPKGAIRVRRTRRTPKGAIKIR